MNDYQKSMTINKPISDVYTSITRELSQWWSNDLTGSAANTGDAFTISFGSTQKTMKIVEALPNERVVWKCVKAYINNASLQNKAEWEETHLIWAFKSEGQKTTLTFLHQGLNTGLECYDLCEEGWEMFLASLEAYLNTGKGNPFIKKAHLAV